MNKIKRAVALTAAFLITLSIVLKPIEVSASPAPVLGAPQIIMTSGGGGLAAGTAGATLGGICLVGGAAIVGAEAIANGLDNGTIDNRVEEWFWNEASEWVYGYNEAQVRGEIYKAELTYGDLQALGALLQEAYPEGCITAPRGDIRTYSEMSDFRIPVDQPIFITDISQHGETAFSYCLQLSYSHYRTNNYVSGPANLDLLCTRVTLPDGSSSGGLSGSGSVNSLPTNYGDYVSAYITFQSGILTTEYTLKDDRSELYNGTFTKDNQTLTSSIQAQFNDRALITTTLPTYIPGEGVALDGDVINIQDVIDSLEEIPYGMSEDDIAISIPVTGEDAGEDSKPVISDSSEIIENTPDVAIDGSFSNLKLPKTISTVFPFCLPFDFYNGIRLFSSQPVTPRFEIPVKIPNPSALGGGYFCDEVIVIDLSKFEKIGRLSRVLTTCIFLFFLIQLSTKIVKGAGA